jgi:hypothetical protein
MSAAADAYLHYDIARRQPNDTQDKQLRAIQTRSENMIIITIRLIIVFAQL